MTITFRATDDDRRTSGSRESRRALRKGPGSLRLRIDLCLADLDAGTPHGLTGLPAKHSGDSVDTLERSHDHWSTRVSA